MSELFIARSTHGQISANKSDGEVRVIVKEGNDRYFGDITKFDVEEYKKHHGVAVMPDYVDILDLGYWYKFHTSIEYEEPAHDWRRLMIALAAGAKFVSRKLFNDYLKEYRLYSSLSWCIEADTLEGSVTLVINSTSSSELDGSTDGQLGIYTYDTHAELKADVELLESLGIDILNNED